MYTIMGGHFDAVETLPFRFFHGAYLRIDIFLRVSTSIHAPEVVT